MCAYCYYKNAFLKRSFTYPFCIVIQFLINDVPVALFDLLKITVNKIVG